MKVYFNSSKGQNQRITSRKSEINEQSIAIAHWILGKSEIHYFNSFFVLMVLTHSGVNSTLGALRFHSLIGVSRNLHCKTQIKLVTY